MKNTIFTLLFLCLFNCFSQENLWQKTSDFRIASLEKMDRAVMPKDFQLFNLNFNKLKSLLAYAPLDSQNFSNLIIEFPDSNGDLKKYKIFEAPIMEKGLSNLFPDCKSYIGKGIDDLTATIRFSATIFGLHTMTFSGNSETFYIDTYTKDLVNYIVYKRSDLAPTRNFNCSAKSFLALDNIENAATVLRASDGKFRTFRLAMASTIEYSAYHIAAAGLNAGTLVQKKAAVLAAMTVTMTRVNGIYEKDMSLRMVLVANNNLIIFIDADDFTNNNGDILINEGQAQITSIIGSNNFDIGHVVSTGNGVDPAGAASPAPCDNAKKASGITGSINPVGDPYDVDYVSHEMGHQYGANHTFRNSCGGNVNGSTAVEPGSGSTIMAYAGICAPNVQGNSDAYFHAISIAQMIAQINSTSNCAAFVLNNNAAPVANAGLDYTIPKGTAYVLQGAATDDNGDNLTYCWEGIDTQSATQPPTQTATGGPNFRSLNPNISPNRYMPRLSSVVAGIVNPTWEVISNVARTQNFALTVRDNAAVLGGQTGLDDMVLTVNATAGPFVVTSQNTAAISWTGGSLKTITWNVAGTNSNGINTTRVNILLSTDNGLTFTTPLIASTPNDGSETITIPNNINSSNCRLMIQAVNNIYYAVNSQKFAVIINANLASSDFASNDFKIFPNPSQGNFKISFNSNSDNLVTVAVNDIRGRKIFQKSYASTSLFEQEIKLSNAQSGIYLITIINGNNQTIRKIVIE